MRRRAVLAAAGAIAAAWWSTAAAQEAPPADAGPPDQAPGGPDPAQAPGGQDPAQAPEAPAGPRVDPPALVTPAEPVFPERALAERVHGVVVVELTISEEGAVTDAAVGSLTVIPESGDPRVGDGRYGFGPAALEAARRMVFRPALMDGKPFAVQINYTFRFVLPPRPEEPEAAEQPARPAGPPRVNFRGVLLERGTRSVVPGATVTVYRKSGDQVEGYEATSGADGSFEFYDLPDGEWKVRIEREGYIPVETDEALSTEELVEGRYWIEKGSYSEYDVTIEAERPRKEVNRRSLSVDEITKVAGTISDDPVLVIENLPGVARAGPIGGQIIVRGSGPEDTGVFINGIGVPLIYHFGGLKSVVPSTVVGGIDFYPGNYSVAYGRAMGGVFDLQLKRLEPDIVHGSADVSVLDTSLYLEVPLGDDAAIAFAGRRSYVDYVLDATIPEDAGLSLVRAP
ncbi:MAG TPA: TonB family protein, partial [Kofleriaceae bacterium]|nr:TonB family protein [Kofleriaceae bacterium]